MVTKFRKKPITIEAVQWFKHGDHPDVKPLPDVMQVEADSSDMDASSFGWIATLEGGHIVSPGDWVIKGIKGELYPCKPDIFEATYEVVK